MILDEPTRGIDVGAKSEVHHLMGELARQGKSIVMISSDLPEVLAMSDRIIVMREGRITGEFSRSEATQESIMNAATGQRLLGVPASAGMSNAAPCRLKPGTPVITTSGAGAQGSRILSSASLPRTRHRAIRRNHVHRRRDQRAADAAT